MVLHLGKTSLAFLAETIRIHTSAVLPQETNALTWHIVVLDAADSTSVGLLGVETFSAKATLHLPLLTFISDSCARSISLLVLPPIDSAHLVVETLSVSLIKSHGAVTTSTSSIATIIIFASFRYSLASSVQEVWSRLPNAIALNWNTFSTDLIVLIRLFARYAFSVILVVDIT